MSTPEPGGPAHDGRFGPLMAGTRQRATAVQARFAALLDQHQNRPLLDVALRTYRRDREIAGTARSPGGRRPASTAGLLAAPSRTGRLASLLHPLTWCRRQVLTWEPNGCSRGEN